jgi:hypothetical protein
VPHIDLSECTVDIDWDKQGQPILYIMVRGRFNTPHEAVEALKAVVDTVNSGPFNHSCSVYNMFEVTHVPMLARFVKSGRMPTTPRTAHIILGTTNQMVQLIASLLAVTGSKRMRTISICKTQEEMDQALRRWLSLPEEARGYIVDNAGKGKQ